NDDDQVLLPLPRRRKRRARLSRSLDGKAPHPAGPAVDRRVVLQPTGQTEAVMSMPAEQEVMEIQGHPTCRPGQRVLVEMRARGPGLKGRGGLPSPVGPGTPTSPRSAVASWGRSSTSRTPPTSPGYGARSKA